MTFNARVVSRIRTSKTQYARIRLEGQNKNGVFKFLDIEDFGELCIDDQVTVKIERTLSAQDWRTVAREQITEEINMELYGKQQ